MKRHVLNELIKQLVSAEGGDWRRNQARSLLRDEHAMQIGDPVVSKFDLGGVRKGDEGFIENVELSGSNEDQVDITVSVGSELVTSHASHWRKR